jgi:nucleoside-diphosphate-sugar epimerase
MYQHILLTGASGFIGRSVARVLSARGAFVTAVVRRSGSAIDEAKEWVFEGDDFIDLDAHWPVSLRCDAVIHMAARVHVMRESAGDSLAAYRATNVDGTLRVAQAARRAGARRFVFVSSIKAVGESSHGHAAFSESVSPEPTDPYGISKLEAERALAEFGSTSGLEVVIVRPPLVYGPGVRANFLQLMSAIAKGLPLPLGAVQSRRSMIFVENLADALVRCATDSRAAGGLFHVNDGHDLSVSELVCMLASVLRVPNRCLAVPPALLRVAGRLTGRSAQVARLLDDLQVDSSHIAEVLGWQPPYTVEQGLTETAAWYRTME